MDKYRPKRPTSLALFPQLPQAGTQDSINNNSLGKKDSWKESRSSSPLITGDVTPSDVRPKAEDKVRHGAQRRPAPKPPSGAGSNLRSSTQATAPSTDTRARTRERLAPGPPQTSNTPRSQRRAAAAGGGAGRGAGRGATTMREKNLGELKGKEGSMDRRGGRLCEETRTKDKDRSQKQREASTLKGRGTDGRGRGAPKVSNKGGVKPNNKLSNKEVYLPSMVVPRTPVTQRKKNQDQGQNHDRTQDPPVLSRSSSEGGSNRMSLSSDTEGPPPGPLQPPLSHITNPDISEEDGEGDPTPCLQNGLTRSFAAGDGTTASCEVEGGGAVKRAEVPPEAAAGLCYDSIKYTLVVDECAQLELVSLRDCTRRNEDSDAETVYQSANEEEDPEYEVERQKSEEARKQEKTKEEKRRRKEEEEAKKRREEDLKRRREEEVKRRREVVGRFCKQSKVASTTSEEDDSTGGRVCAPRSRKFLNLFANSSSPYSATGASSFGMFSCVLDGVERQQSHRAVYRFVPRHADELQLETDDPVLMLNQSEDLWCQGYNMRTGASGIFPAFYAVQVPKDHNYARKDGRTERFVARFLGSVQVPVHTGNDVLCAAMRKGDQCFHFFHLKNISFCGCHPKHSRYFGFITKHPDHQRFACHVLMSDSSLQPLAEAVGRAFRQYYKEHIGYSCPTEDIFIE
uniref:Mitogen-activated protein kinase 8 interacting protein 1a n=1 Tax=Oryzias latipes TaxID=8090 RepID=A0A3P9MB99_ORYLA